MDCNFSVGDGTTETEEAGLSRTFTKAVLPVPNYQ